MSTPIKRRLVLIPNEGTAPKSKVIQAFAAAIKLANDLGRNEITLLLRAKGTIDENFFDGFLSGKACSKLRKPDGKITVNGITVRCESPQTNGQLHGVVLAFYLSSADLEDAQTTSYGINAIIFVPWLKEEGSSWYSTWNPSVIGTVPTAHQVNLPDAVIVIFKLFSTSFIGAKKSAD